jgi:predicted ATPase/class 3 adenylate cyclase/DNA-binding CsgD family transcriptional regulator
MDMERLQRTLRWTDPPADTGAAFTLPVGTVTLLLADIEGSVRLWESDRRRMTAAVGRFNEIVTDEVGRHGGVRPVEQGEGDSFVAAFPRASDALACAIAIQLAMDELKVRMALHTGDVQLRDSGNYVGSAINRCARLRALAHGGQVLLSRTTHDLVAEAAPDGVTFRDLGTHRLRDLARAEHVFQLAHPDLETDFPPLRSLDLTPNNLPAQLTSFVGRTHELAEVRELLRTCRLLTLTGTGGCGKTRLALHVAADALHDYLDGAWFVDLSPITEPDRVTGTVAEVFGRMPEPDRPYIDTLADHLRARRALIVLDNCEHLVEAAAAVADALVRSCPDLTVLATSRERLGVEGETAWRVPSLALPDEAEPAPIETLATYDAVRLFVDRAVRARPNFAVTNRNAPAVAAICRRLDGIPLAIELAASRVRVLTVEQIAAGLDDRFHFLAAGARTALPRQQTLVASVDWSHELLTEPERALLRRLSVFAGGFDLDAAEAVAAGDPVEPYQVLDLLTQLLDKSLVLMEDDRTRARYRLLETIRAYGQDRLIEAGEVSAYREAHLRWAASLLRRAAGRLTGPDQIEWFRLLDADHENIRAAQAWAVATRNADAALTMVLQLVWFWNVRGHWAEGQRGARAALALGDGSPVLREFATFAEAAMGGMLGDLDGLFPVLSSALERARREGDHFTAAWSLNQLGKFTMLTSLAEASALLDESATYARSIGDTSCLVDTLTAKAWMQLCAGDLRGAKATITEAHRIAGEARDARAMAISLTVAGWVALREGSLGEAESVLDQALEIASAVGDEATHSQALLRLGELELKRGDYGYARKLIEEGVERSQNLGSPFIGGATQFLGQIAMATGDLAEARMDFELAARTGHAIDTMFYGSTDAGLGMVDLFEGRLESARTCFESTLSKLRAIGARLHEARVLYMLSAVDLRQGDPSRAEATAHESLDVAVAVGDPADIANALHCIADAAAAVESHAEAARLTGAAAGVRERFGLVPVPNNRHAPYEELAREALGDAYDAAFAEGRELSTDEAIAYSRRGRGERKRPSSGWASLTPTELDVVRLVAEGLTNPQIAKRLFVSRNTVKMHLSNVFAKLGVATRSALTAEATRRER